jgi:hypothetical protein
MVYFNMNHEIDDEEEFCELCEEYGCDGGQDCAEWEPEYEEPHERWEREAEASALQEMDRVGPDYWRDPDSGEMRLG